MDQDAGRTTGQDVTEAGSSEKPKLPAKVHVMCGWPLLLVTFGGAIGGGLGGAAYGINVAIYRSRFPVAIKILLNMITGVTAIAIWLTIAVVIQGGRN